MREQHSKTKLSFRTAMNPRAIQNILIQIQIFFFEIRNAAWLSNKTNKNKTSNMNCEIIIGIINILNSGLETN